MRYIHGLNPYEPTASEHHVERYIWYGPSSPGGVLDFGLDGGVPPGPRDPNPCLEVKKVPMFRDFAQKMDPRLGIFWKFSGLALRAQKILVILTKNGPMFRDLGGQKWDPCLGIFCQKPTHLGGTSPYSVSMEVPPPGLQDLSPYLKPHRL